MALRARLEARMKARLDGEDWNGLDETLKDFAKLTPPDHFAKRLTQLKDDAAHQQAELKQAVLTKTAQAYIADLQSMIDRYLDDETYRAYVDALECEPTSSKRPGRKPRPRRRRWPRLKNRVRRAATARAAPAAKAAAPAAKAASKAAPCRAEHQHRQG